MDDIEELRRMAAAEGSDIEIPDDVDMEDVGPALLGKKPLIGSFRRENDMPVLRDEIGEKIEEEL